MSKKSRKSDTEMDEVHIDGDAASVHRTGSTRSAASTRSARSERDDEQVLDIENRDPNDLNSHIGTAFEDVIGEPEGAHSTDCVWVNAYKCFSGGKGLCYKIMTFVCALPLALCWGCQFACITFSHIWYITPCLRAFNMNFSCLARLFSTVVRCCCDPFYESMALMFTKIFVHNVQSGSYSSLNPEALNMMKGHTAKTMTELNEV